MMIICSKKTKNVLTWILVCVITLFSQTCSRPEHTETRYRLDLSTSIKTSTLCPDFNLSSLGHFERQLVLDESEYLLSSLSFYPYDNKSVFVAGSGYALRISLPGGKVLSQFSRMGRGPQEYLSISGLFFRNGKVWLEDVNGGKLIVCDTLGGVEQVISVGRNESLIPLDGDAFLKTYPVNSPAGHLYDILDEEMRVHRTSKLSLPDVRSEAFLFQNAPQIIGGDLFIQPQFSAYYYKITVKEETPWLYLDAGSYEMPPKVRSDPVLLEAEQDHYLNLQSLIIVGSLAFVEYWMDGLHRVVYEMETGEILFNIVVKTGEEPQTGILLKSYGKYYSVWPVFSDEYFVICESYPGEELWLFSR